MGPDERLLLAAFGEKESAVDAWRAWSAERDLNALDAFELRLLPPAYRTLRDAGVDESEIPSIVKQMARATFVRTRLTLRDGAATAAMLAGHGIDSVLLKGAALVAAEMLDPGVRPMSDFDLLVRPADVARVVALLEAAAWRADPPLDRDFMAFLHAARFKRGEASCDLHWQALWESPDDAADARFWDAAEIVSVDGVSLRVLRPEHQVLTVIVHGTRVSDAAAVRWIGDALSVLRVRGEQFDWEMFASEAEARRVTYPVGESLEYLRERYGAPVPHDVIRRLRDQHVSWRQRRLYAPRPQRMRPSGAIYLGAMMHVAARQRSGRLTWFRRNLQRDLKADTLPGLAGAVARKMFRAAANFIARIG